MNRLVGSSIVVGLILAGCSAEKHPPEDQLKTVLEMIAPQLIGVQSVSARYAPSDASVDIWG